MKNNKELILGIDLGTTYSCVGIWKNRKVEIIPNEIGERTTPSIVSFNKNERLIGKSAKNKNKNIIYDAKRLIGRNYDDKEIQEDMKYWPFKVIKDDNNRPLFEIKYDDGKIEKFYPEEISAIILSKLKKNAENFYGHEINDAIITVPAYFNDLQRQCTINAGKIAGLNVIRIINEPTAAAIAYGLQNNNNEKKYILVFDFGGGTLDVTILLLNKKIFEVKSTCGNSHLGGEDLDNEIMKYCINEFKNETNIDLSNNKKAINRLKNECEKTKIELSTTIDTILNIDNITTGKDLNIEITRGTFEEMCQKYFYKCFEIIKQALKDANLKKEQIDDIVLVGGSSRIPKIQEMIQNYFNKTPHKTINPDEAIASGAAIIGATRNNLNDIELKDLKIIDITSLSLGIGLSNGEMDVIIPKNSKIPCKKTINYRTIKDNQKKIILKIYQGERKYSKSNIYLGNCVLNNIPPKPKGSILINVTFSIDVNGVLKVSAKENSGGIENEINIDMIYNGLNKEKIDELIENDDKIIEEDIQKLELNKKRNELIETCNYYEKDGSQKQKKMASEILEWTKKNHCQEKNMYEAKLKEMKECH